jgi:hypothetical protein
MRGKDENCDALKEVVLKRQVGGKDGRDWEEKGGLLALQG